MKKKIILILLLAVLIIIVSILLLTINHNNEMKRYEQIKKDVRDEAITYLTITIVPESGKKAYLYEDDIVNPLHRGANKKIILDVDDTSYCRVSIEGFEKNSKWDANVYLKCKKYEDELYEETLLHVLCERGIEKDYEEYYDKYGWFYDSFNCPERIKDEMN